MWTVFGSWCEPTKHKHVWDNLENLNTGYLKILSFFFLRKIIKTLFIWTVWGSHKIRKGREISHILPSSTRVQRPPLLASPIRPEIRYASDGPSWDIIITWCPQFMLQFTHSRAVHSMRLTCTHLYSVILSSFTALKFLCALLIHSQPFPTPGNRWYFYCLHGFAFTRMLHSWSHMVCSRFRLVSFRW